jgi:hypothetical protein
VFSKLDRARVRGDVAVIIGGNLAKAPHLATLEGGATITPKAARALAVPIGRMANRHGAARYQAKDVKANPGLAGMSRTFVRNDVVLGETAGGEVVPLFALRRSIVFPRRAIFKNFARKNAARISREVEVAVGTGLRAAEGAGDA